MTRIAIANPKGGVGKSTLSTHVAGYLASRGYSVMLGDADVQHSARLWLSLRPPTAKPISYWEVDPQEFSKPPKGADHYVLDTPAALAGKALKDVLKWADKVLVPLQASIFDIYATRSFLDDLAASRHAENVEVGIVAMRVDERTLSADQLSAFVKSLDLPKVGTLRDTQNYVHLAANGLTVFDVQTSRMEQDREQWKPIGKWLERG
jgi:chromosome partitioning protein